MSTTKDWLKKNHEELYDQVMLTTSYLQSSGNRERMGLCMSTAQGQWYDTQFMPPFGVFQVAFDDWKDPIHRSPLKSKTLMDAELVFRPIYRKFYTGFLKESPLVSDEDLVSMGMPARNTGRTPSPVEKSYPDYEIDSSTIRRLAIHYFDPTKRATRGKPPGQHGAEIRWAILDSPPKSINELVNSSFITRSPLILDFDESQRGKTVYFCLRWENTRGEKGPWSEIVSAIIP
jgi:hypothetical protein